MKPAPQNYAPNEGGITVAALQFLQTDRGVELRRAALEIAVQGQTVAAVARLRRDFPADAVAAALSMAAVQDKALKKFAVPKDAWVWAVPEALEQSSGRLVAQHKARRFAAALAQLHGAGQPEIHDLCAGIGGDALALATVAPVVAVELSQVRALCLAANAKDFPPAYLLQIARADVAAYPGDPAALFHIDPARRSAGRRRHGYQDLIPGPEILNRIIHHYPGGALKLSPAVDFDDLPPGHLEVISENGAVVQAVLWTGILAQTLGGKAVRSATVLRDSAPLGITVSGAPQSPGPCAAPREFIYEVDGAVHRAGLATQLARDRDLQSLSIDGGYLTGSQPIDHLALRGFEHLETMPFNEKRVAAALKQLTPASGPVEVKTRGGLDLDTDQLQRQWNKTGAALTVLIYRGVHDKIYATLARRI